MKKEAEHKHLAPKKKRAGNTAKKVTIICVVVVALLMAGAAGFGIYVSGSDTIYPKVSLNGTDLGGMTVSEAADALTAAGWGEGDKTITVELEQRSTHPLYGKVVRSTKKVKAHDEHNDAHVGDLVSIMETRPLSKTKRWRLESIIERAK